MHVLFMYKRCSSVHNTVMPVYVVNFPFSTEVHRFRLRVLLWMSGVWILRYIIII